MNTHSLARWTATLMAAVLAAAATAGAAQQTGFLRGTVMDDQSNPLEGVRVTVTTATLPEPIEGRTAADGTFAVELPDVTLAYEVAFEIEGYQGVAHEVDAQKMQNASLEVRLPKQEPLSAKAARKKGKKSGEDEAPSLSEERHTAILLFNEGVEALHAEDLDTANAKFHAAIEADPTFPEPYRALSATAGEAEDWAAAAEYADKLLEFEPDNIQAMNTVYFGDLMVGDVSAAKSAAERLAAASPESLPQILDHANTFFANNEFEMARALYEVYTANDPDQPGPYFALGVSCNALGGTDAARAAFTRFLELAPPDDPDRGTAEEMLTYLQ